MRLIISGNYRPWHLLRHRPWSFLTGAMLTVAMCGVAGGVAAGSASAADVQRLGVYRDWSVYKADQGQEPVCWLASRPKRQEGNFTKRGDTYIRITQRPSEKALDVVSLVAGYTFSTDDPVSIQVGGRTFQLFADADTAWTADSATDRALTQAIRQGTTLIVKGISSRGTRTTDTYSLSGTDDAYRAAAAACGMATP